MLLRGAVRVAVGATEFDRFVNWREVVTDSGREVVTHAPLIRQPPAGSEHPTRFNAVRGGGFVPCM